MRVKAFVLVITLILIVSCCRAQNSPPDSLKYSNTATHVIDYFNSSITDRSEICNGAIYDAYPPGNKGSLYFRDKNYCIPSMIRYSGTWYKNVPVLYDVHNDFMVSTSDNNLFVLSSQKISDVYLLNHHFIYVAAKGADNLIPGFYDELYNGQSQVLIKRTKFIDEHILASLALETFYKDISIAYIKKGDKYYQVDSKGAFMDAFKDKKKDLNRYMRDNKIDYKRDKEDAIVKLADYYDQINK